MAKTKISLLPCAPGNLDEMNKWINEEAEQGWQITGSVFRLPFLARFRQGEGGPYHLSCYDLDGDKVICRLAGQLYVLAGYPDEDDEDIDEIKSAISSVADLPGMCILLEFVFAYYVINHTRLVEYDSFPDINTVFSLISALIPLIQLVILLPIEFGSSFIRKRKHRSVWPIFTAYVLILAYIISMLIVVATGMN